MSTIIIGGAFHTNILCKHLSHVLIVNLLLRTYVLYDCDWRIIAFVLGAASVLLAGGLVRDRESGFLPRFWSLTVFLVGELQFRLIYYHQLVRGVSRRV